MVINARSFAAAVLAASAAAAQETVCSAATLRFTTGGSTYERFTVYYDERNGIPTFEARISYEDSFRLILYRPYEDHGGGGGGGGHFVGDEAPTAAPTAAPTYAPTIPYSSSTEGDMPCAGSWLIALYKVDTQAYYYPALNTTLSSAACSIAEGDLFQALSDADWLYYEGDGKNTEPAPADVSIRCDKKLDFEITVVSATGDTKYQRYFEEAAARWAEVIVGDLPGYVAYENNDWFDGFFKDIDYKYDGPIDDVVIGYSVVDMDGPGGTLAQSGPIYYRDLDPIWAGESALSWTTISGVMQFDVADVKKLIRQDSFLNVILHEMGHVLGIGSQWVQAGCAFCSVSSLGVFRGDVHYDPDGGVCPAAGLSFDALGPAEGEVLLVEDTGGLGTACSHWSEAQMVGELMTGSAERGGRDMPLSVVTVATLQDLGYQVDFDAADEYELPKRTTTRNRRRAEEGENKEERLNLHDDILALKPKPWRSGAGER